MQSSQCATTPRTLALVLLLLQNYEGSSAAVKHTKDTPVQAKIDQKRFLLGHLLQQAAKKAKLGRLIHGGKNKINGVAINESFRRSHNSFSFSE